LYLFLYGRDEELAKKELILKDSLRKALLNNEFTLHYQPQLNIKTGKAMNMEALIRWNHPECGMISPADFIPLAEKSGQIGAIGDWVIDTSLQMVNRIKKKNIHFENIAINVSAVQLREQSFVEKLKERLAFHHVSPTSLEIEITESVLIDHEEETIQQLVALKQLGIQIALDDFGTGYSSLNYLRMMPIDRVKVDQSFIRRIEDDSIVQAILNTIVTLGHTLGFKIVAEGVEEESQHKILYELNVDYIQGYRYSKPLDEETVLEFLRQQS
jgi:EAL domain-containing protein (putative c-di-GMP-specific phosphodiesterase class I)